MATDFHDKCFDGSTLTKLELFKKYLNEWLPVFIRDGAIWPSINIFDLFCGPGTDESGESGSPIIILESLNEYSDVIQRNSLHVNVFFNDDSDEKINNLKEKIKNEELGLGPINIAVSCKDFGEAFSNNYNLMANKQTANFLFIDQCGISKVTEPIFSSIIQLKQTDLLFFISSSYLTTRFPHLSSMTQYLDVGKEKDHFTSHRDSHRAVWDHFKKLVPNNKIYYVAPFSLKKGSNIYGLIFGSGNRLGYEKFLKVCWEVDEFNGEANFNIDDDFIPQNGQLSIFNDIGKSKRLRDFEDELKNRVLDRSLESNRDVAEFAYQRRFLPVAHAKPVILELQEYGKIRKERIGFSNKSKYKKIELL